MILLDDIFRCDSFAGRYHTMETWNLFREFLLFFTSLAPHSGITPILSEFDIPSRILNLLLLFAYLKSVRPAGIPELLDKHERSKRWPLDFQKMLRGRIVSIVVFLDLANLKFYAKIHFQCLDLGNILSFVMNSVQ